MGAGDRGCADSGRRSRAQWPPRRRSDRDSEDSRAAGFAAAVAANVTGVANGDTLAAAVQARFGIPLDFARVQGQCSGLVVAYADPSRLGVDRWLQMVALWRELRSGFVVASAGTALTFDAVNADGRHLGGVIAPGLLTAQQAVLGATRFAAGAPDATYTKGLTEGLGCDTDSCVRQGALHSCAGLIERLASRHVRSDTPRILTGGDAGDLVSHLSGDWLLRSELVLEGLAALPDAAI